MDKVKVPPKVPTVFWDRMGRRARRLLGRDWPEL